MAKRIAVLGSTGSIGTNALSVIADAPTRYVPEALSAFNNFELFLKQLASHRPKWAVAANPNLVSQIKPHLPAGTELLTGDDGLVKIATLPEIDVVLAAIVGAAGLRSTLAAVGAGKRVALANKETMVIAGEIVNEMARKSGAEIIPVDSEHSAIFQAISERRSGESIRRIILTASGGPFRTKSLTELEQVTPEQAKKHPTWSMGTKITIDSATMMNKALEIIEARWLFDIHAEKIQVVIHPQSIVHSMVEFVDGSVLAQLSPPDMKLPIQYAFSFPERHSGVAARMNWEDSYHLEFSPPDHSRFPALQLGLEVAQKGGTTGAVVNAANEAAVQAFLDRKIKFTDIVPACRKVLESHHFSPRPSLEELLEMDRWARLEIMKWIGI